MIYEETAEAFTTWLVGRVDDDATGAAYDTLDVAPSGRFWLGQLVPEEETRESSLGDRAERVAPCSCGVRVRVGDGLARSTVDVTVSGRVWSRVDKDDDEAEGKWRRSAPFDVTVAVPLDQPGAYGLTEVRGAIGQATGSPAHEGTVDVETYVTPHGREAVVTFVNRTPRGLPRTDSTLYEVVITAEFQHAPPAFAMEALPTSFRYSREVPAYGVNAGVQQLGPSTFRTQNVVSHRRGRPEYWDQEHAGPVPDLTFEGLADNPVARGEALVDSMRVWGQSAWSGPVLARRRADEGWDDAVAAEAADAAEAYRSEVERVAQGVGLLRDDPDMFRAFQLTNEAFGRAARGRYDAWRPFQVGFQLASLPGLLPGPERDTVDTLWFATGGGKTETYLGLVVLAAFHDRLTGATTGVAAWARFPLRLLSLQQTQRFADVLAAAELVRREAGLDGDEFGLGFLVGGSSTPNRFPPDPSTGDPDYRDASAHRGYRVLLHCPFCRSEALDVRFDSARWCLDHICTGDDCPSGGRLPFRIVDDEIFRFLPTVVVGTIDKTAGLGFQASLAGMYGPPYGFCSADGHGHTYAPRSSRPRGCLVPGCDVPTEDLPQDPARYGPTLRIQDELHLLRDSLGAMASHYESVLDALQERHGPRAKILASSATLAGYEDQVGVLYRREGRVFPVPGPTADRSLWSVETPAALRTYLGAAPRGMTIDFAADRLVEAIQRAVREVEAAPSDFAELFETDEPTIRRLVSDYGTSVTYGSTLRDVEAAARSFETQVPIDGALNAVTLTGRVPFETVREALGRLEDPEEDFSERIHLVAASSMISHGVDVDRLNVMTMMGLPLTTAEFIQATARVGRARPGLVFVLHKMLRQRDATVYRSFDLFVKHGDRLVEPVPVTARSRNVLKLTFPGLFMARVLGLHERTSLDSGGQTLTTTKRLRTAFREAGVSPAAELAAMVDMLGATDPLDEKLREDLALYLNETIEDLLDPATEERFPREVLARVLGGEPMLSLRDVDASIPVYEGRNR